ncbi:glycosyl transferase, partial [Shigella flexneri]|nr:glycosyl transferase [Shigella flexneri]
MATYNGECWIEEQLKSIIEQKDVDISIFISDDLSTDNTLNICEEFQLSYPSIINILPSVNKFGGAGKNFYRLIKDVDLENYDYICFSDQDDIWYKDKIKNAIDCLVFNNANCYSSNVIAYYPSGQKNLVDKAQSQTQFDYFFEAAGPGCTYVIKKETLIEFKKFIINNKNAAQDICLHDWFLYSFARTRNYSWYIDRKPTMLYRQHENNQVGANISFKAKYKRLGLVRNKWYRKEVTKIANALADDSFVN